MSQNKINAHNLGKSGQVENQKHKEVDNQMKHEQNQNQHVLNEQNKKPDEKVDNFVIQIPDGEKDLKVEINFTEEQLNKLRDIARDIITELSKQTDEVQTVRDRFSIRNTQPFGNLFRILGIISGKTQNLTELKNVTGTSMTFIKKLNSDSNVRVEKESVKQALKNINEHYKIGANINA